MGRGFFRTWPQISRKIPSRWPSSNSAQNFDQIPTPALGLTILSELHLEIVAPRFEEIQGRQTADLSLSRQVPDIPASTSVIVELEHLERQRLA